MADPDADFGNEYQDTGGSGDTDDVAVADDAARMVVMDDDGGAHDADDGSQSYSTRLHVKLTTPMLKTTRWQF